MSGHRLIDSYLATLAGRLPVDVVDELADGLVETYRRQLTAGAGADEAAAAAVDEFGAPDVVVAAFVRQSPGRRLGVRLIRSGPVVGACWAAALLSGGAVAWPVPVPARVVFGVVLVVVVAALAVAVASRTSYRRTLLSGPAGCALLGLDVSAVLAVAVVAPSYTWPLVLASAASLGRVVLTARAMPRLLAR